MNAPDYYIDKVIYINHVDGDWRFKVYIEDETIHIAYEEKGEDGWKTLDSIGGIWKSAAALLIDALTEISELEHVYKR